MRNKSITINPQIIFLIIGLIYGLSFLLVTPPFQVGDEGEHFDKSLYLSEGHIIPEKLGNKVGYYVPESADNLKLKSYTALKDKHEKIKMNNILSLIHQPLNDSVTAFTSVVSTTAIITYSPIPYLASAFAIKIGEILNFSPIILLYVGRLANLLVWLFLIYLAIKITPVHKWVLLMLSLMPMTIFQGASLSADSFTIAISFLFIAVFLKFSFDSEKKEIDNKDICILSILMLILSLAKSFYFILACLFFLIPAEKFKSKRKMFLIFTFLFISCFAISNTWSLAVNSFYAPIAHYVSIPGQISFILSNPLSFPDALINTFSTKNILFPIIGSFVGNLGWNAVNVLNWLILIYLSMLTLTALLDKNHMVINFERKLIIFITFSIVFILICASMYITGTPVGQNTIGAIAGRYLIPIAPLLFLLFYNNKIKFNIKKGFNLIIICLIIISLTITIYLLIANFYIIY